MMHAHYAVLAVTVLDTDRRVLHAAMKLLPAEVRRDPCRRLLRRKFYCAMLRYHAEAQRRAFPSCH